MKEELPICPECGYPLTGIRVYKDKARKIAIEFFCDEAGDDKFSFQILTGITDKDIEKMKVGKPLRKEMSVKLLERMSEEEALKSYEADRNKHSE